MNDATIIGAAVALQAAGVAALRQAWATRKSWRPFAVIGGWAAIAASAPLCTETLGAAPGLAAGAAAATAIAYLAVAANISFQARKRERATSDALDPEARPPKNTWRAVGRVVAAGPLAGVASYAAAGAIALAVPGRQIDTLASAAFLLPLFWGALATWALADHKLVRVFAGQTIAAAVCTGLMFWGAPA